MPNWKARGSARKPSNLRVTDPVAFNYYYAQVSWKRKSTFSPYFRTVWSDDSGKIGSSRLWVWLCDSPKSERDEWRWEEGGGPASLPADGLQHGCGCHRWENRQVPSGRWQSSLLSDQEDESERVHAEKPVERVGIACVQGSWRKVNIIVQIYQIMILTLVIVIHYPQGSWELQGKAAEQPR